MRRRSSSDSWLFRHSGWLSVTPVRPKSVAAALMLAVAVLAASAPCRALLEDVSIAELRVTGNLRTEQSAIANTFALEPGKTYPYAEVRAGLERVFNMNFFDDVRLYTEDAPAGKLLTIEVVERPIVTSIKTTGHTKIDKEKVMSKITLSVGASLDQRLVHESIAAIKALYKEKGFYLADVTSEVSMASPGSAVLTFRIEEGLKSKVGRIAIEGNSLVGDGAVKKAMETEESFFRSVPFLKRWTRKDFNPEKVDTDVEKVERLYKEKGFANAKVVSRDVAIDRERGLANITLTVAEGPRYYVRQTDVEIAEPDETEGAVTEEAIAKGIRLEAGGVYSISEVEKSIEAMYSIIGEQGFVYAEIEPVETFDADSVSLRFKVNPGPPVHVSKIVIEGNETTFEKVIRRELLIRPGDIFRRSLVERSYRDVFNLGYFEDVEISSRVVNEKGDIDLIFRVKEKQIGIFNVGAGYSEEFGLTGFIEFAHPNLGWFKKRPYLGLGKGESLNLRWEFGRLSQIELGYRNPWFRDRPTLVGIDIYDTKRQYETYDDRRSGFGMVVGRRFPLIDYSKVYVRYNLERVELVPDEGKASSYVKSQAGERTMSGVTATLVRNSVDNPFFPRDGSRTTISGEWVAGWVPLSVVKQSERLEKPADPSDALLPDWNVRKFVAYQSYVIDSSNFMTVPLMGSCLVFRLRTSVLKGLGNLGYIPLDQRFRLGGAALDGVRGYDDREIVPAGNDSDVGGKFMMLGTLEYRVPVVKNQAFIRGFMDAGDTWNSLRAARPAILKRSAGLGFMIEIPMVGQIGLDFGYGFDRDDESGGPGWKTHFQFGMSGF